MDLNNLAKKNVDNVTKEEISEQHIVVPEKNRAAVELGRLGGIKGGPARAAKLSKEKRSEIALKAAKARWGKE